MKRIGELLEAKTETFFGAAEVAAMSAATSPGTGLAYGLRRVCAAWGMARSSFYAMTSGQHAEQPPAKRRGPKPAISDQALLVAIEADLEASPWEGEGYRKVWARLRVCRDIRVARKRVLRLMRENNLLSPHRCRRRGGNPHDGEIITHAPNLMWGTDGVRVFTVDDGWGWIFTAVEHWNAECVGWHVCKRGDRFAALQPISMPVTISLANKIVAFSALLKEVNGQNSVAMDWSIFAWLVTVLFILPVIVAFIISWFWFWRANWSQSFLEKFGLSLVQRTPKAWDWFFLTQKQGCWIIAELDDGTLVGGQYGPESFSSLSPDREDLYLETCYYVDEYHNFHDPIPDNVGTWINGDKVKKLHFYRVGGEENDGNAQSN